MAVKSVIDIDVNDAHFKRFTELFNKYRDAVAKQPEAWKKVGASTKSTSTNFETMAAAMMAQSHMAKEVGRSSDQSNKTLTRQQGLWNTIHRSTTGVFKNVTGIAKLLTEMGIGLGLGALGFGIGSLFGLLDMGKKVGGDRNKALGFDMSIGQLKAFHLYQGRNLPGQGDAVLAGALQAQNPQMPAGKLASVLKFSPLGSTYDVADRELLAVRDFFRGKSRGAISQDLRSMQFFGGAGFDMSTVETLEHLKPGELKSDIKQGNASIRGLTPHNARGWQDFVSRIEGDFGKMATSIENSFMGSGLLSPIERLMRAVTADIGILVRSPLAKKALTDLASALDRFTNFISTGGFVAVLKEIGDDIKDYEIAKHIVDFPLKMQIWAAKHEIAGAEYIGSGIEKGYHGTTGPTAIPGKPAGTALPVHVTAHSRVHLKVTQPPGSNTTYSIGSASGWSSH